MARSFLFRAICIYLLQIPDLVCSFNLNSKVRHLNSKLRKVSSIHEVTTSKSEPVCHIRDEHIKRLGEIVASAADNDGTPRQSFMIPMHVDANQTEELIK